MGKRRGYENDFKRVAPEGAPGWKQSFLIARPSINDWSRTSRLLVSVVICSSSATGNPQGNRPGGRVKTGETGTLGLAPVHVAA